MALHHYCPGAKRRVFQHNGKPCPELDRGIICPDEPIRTYAPTFAVTSTESTPLKSAPIAAHMDEGGARDFQGSARSDPGARGLRFAALGGDGGGSVAALPVRGMGHVKRFTCPVPKETADRCPKCWGM